MAHNRTHLRAAIQKAIDTSELVIEAKEEAVSNCESDPRLEKLEAQLEYLESVRDTLQEAMDQLDDWED